MSAPEVLRTPRLLLRRVRLTDAGDLHDVLGDPRAMRYWSHPAHDSLAQTETWVANMAQADPACSDDYVIERMGRVIGKAGAWELPEIGFLLHPDHWRQGLMREALAVVIPQLFAAHPVDRLTAEADPRNAASIGLLTRMGFAETHRAQNTMQWGDEWCDSVYFALPRPC